VPKMSSELCPRRGQCISNLDRALITRVHTRVTHSTQQRGGIGRFDGSSASHVFPICRYFANDRDYFALPCRRRERVSPREMHTKRGCIRESHRRFGSRRRLGDPLFLSISRSYRAMCASKEENCLSENLWLSSSY